MPLEFVLSQKGNQQLVNKGFVYTTDKIKEDKHIWKCVHYNRHKCLGRVWTAEDIVIFENDKHNHVPDVAEITLSLERKRIWI
ncbi:unnamed protein product [Macrosiphum euphorbiae]|uniref:FLYWCH-type domain-containing protein n=1 Tax=Macrosiphum euphorbiae TaxID=13131 RepID=A0AAV0Y3D4_9HEMI|nr:unnamed protein product [Macrosiphum euphorbiae]CAI6374672.1 unnamed protein product [Macrosiphum euphorbiae]